MMTNDEKTRPDRIARKARRFGYRIARSRQRLNVPNFDNFGDYMLVDAAANCVIFGARFDATLDEIETFLDN